MTGAEKMSLLANRFPTMRGIMGTNPWNVDELIAWLNSGAPTSGSKWAAMFLLGVWNPETNWHTVGLKKSRPAKFDFFSAVAAWDRMHIEAMQEWVNNPFWP